MGYRNYIGKLKKELNTNVTFEDLIERCRVLENNYNLNYISPRMLVNEIHEFGKYVNIKKLEGNLKLYFLNPEVNEFFKSDYEFMEITKEGLELIIEEYAEYIANYYESLLKVDEIDILKGNTVEKKCVSAIESKFRTWKNEYMTPYNLSEDCEHLSDSWEYEHSIFDLVRIYKTFDWENDTMIWYGC